MKLFSLALVTLLAVAATAQAGGHNYSYENCLAEGGCGHEHSWKNGCCERERSCCDHLWDGYGCYDSCCDINLPTMPKINWGCFHGCAGPYRVPCVKLPKIHVPKVHLPCPPPPCCTDSCTSECGDGCTEYACPAPCCPNPLRGFGNHLRTWFHNCGSRACGCDTGCCDAGCCGDGTVTYGYGHGDVHGDVPTNNVPTPVDMDLEAPPIDLPPAPEKEDMKKKKNKDNKTAGIWLFPNLSM